ncbi:MAG TPA: transcription antitermination factor NusB, partial [Bacteroides sp.]|nr:transcription antitermination factor NusB [Bacteroides sp.]
MISRRQLRIKALQSLYAYYQTGRENMGRSEKELHFNIGKAYHLYHYLLLLIIDVILYAESRIELARNKRVPTYDDLHPNTRLIDNRLVDQLRNNEQLLRFVEQHKLNWSNYPELIREIYNKVVSTEEYDAYITSGENDYAGDKRMITHIYSHVIFPNESLAQILE